MLYLDQVLRVYTLTQATPCLVSYSYLRCFLFLFSCESRDRFLKNQFPVSSLVSSLFQPSRRSTEGILVVRISIALSRVSFFSKPEDHLYNCSFRHLLYISVLILIVSLRRIIVSLFGINVRLSYFSDCPHGDCNVAWQTHSLVCPCVQRQLHCPTRLQLRQHTLNNQEIVLKS